LEEQVKPNEPETKQSYLDYGLDLTPEPNDDYIKRIDDNRVVSTDLGVRDKFVVAFGKRYPN